MSGKKRIKQALPSLASIDDFRKNDANVQWAKRLLDDPVAQQWLAALRNYCLRVGAPNQTGGNSEFELGRAFGKSEMITAMLLLAQPYRAPAEIPITYQAEQYMED